MKQQLTIPLKNFILFIIIPALIIISVGIGIFIYNNIYNTILEGFDQKLIAVSSTTGEFIAGEGHQALLKEVRRENLTPEQAELTDYFIKTITPMRQIREKLGLTYLYTQVPGEADDEVIYVLDSNTDEDHTPPGYIDVLPSESLENNRRVLEQGELVVSAVEAWEVWGLLKSAFAPVFNNQGEIVAVAGADVNISVIREKTRFALFLVGSIGFIALIISTLAAIYIAEKLANPMSTIKYAALTVASGEYNHKAEVKDPIELKNLGEDLNYFSMVLQDTIEVLNETNLRTEDMRCKEELGLFLTIGDTEIDKKPVYPFLMLRFNQQSMLADTSDFSSYQDITIFWLSLPERSEPFIGANIRSNLREISKRLIKKTRQNIDMLYKYLEPLFKEHIYSFLILDQQEKKLYLVAEGSLPVLVLTKENPQVKLVSLTAKEPLIVESDQLVLFGSLFIEPDVDEDIALLQQLVSYDILVNYLTRPEELRSKLYISLQQLTTFEKNKEFTFNLLGYEMKPEDSYVMDDMTSITLPIL